MDKYKTPSPKTRRLRGTGIYVGNEFTFRPSEPGEPAQINVKSIKGAKCYETSSEKAPLKVAHLTCAADTADPWQEYNDQLERLGIKPQQIQQKPDTQRVVNEGGMQVWLDAKQGVLTYQGCIDLNKNYNWQSDVMRGMQILVRTLPVHEKFKKLVNKIRRNKK